MSAARNATTIARGAAVITRGAMVIAIGVCLSACGGVSLWPFESGPRPESARVPADAAAYQCEGGKRLYVRLIDNGSAAWVILPEREFRLERSGTAYAVGQNRLEIDGPNASLTEGASKTYAGCKRGS